MMICGSCGMRMDGAAVLACKTRMYDVAQAGHVPVISAMGNLPIVKDLVVDMGPFWDKFNSVDPYLKPGCRYGLIALNFAQKGSMSTTRSLTIGRLPIAEITGT